YYYFFYDWEVKAADCTSPIVPVTVTVDNCTPTSTAQLSENATFKTYPNPNSGQFYLTGNLSNVQQVILYDILGKEQNISVQQLSKRKQLIQLNDFAKGVYHLVIIEKDGTQTVEKLVVR
ncbi:MAG TPA: hypothetical protein DIU39_07065, partial [Flavobacteriales bacterium]|nr:hypothetical protein [Flavobacteriales bacterium]